MPASLAQELCNPDPNKLITGIPYCEETGQTVLKTVPPDKIQNAIKKEKDSNFNFSTFVEVNPFIYGNRNNLQNNYSTQGQYLNPYGSPYNAPQNYYPPNQGYLNPPPQTSPYYDNRYQYVPNTPLDSSPLIIPGSGYNSPGMRQHY